MAFRSSRRGGQEVQMAANTSARRWEVDTIDLSEAANHREAALVVVDDVRNPNF